MNLIIKNGTVVTSKETRKLDIKIQDEKIVDIQKDINPKDTDKVIDASDLIIIPGGIDVHTHFDMDCGTIKTSDDFFSGTKAAIMGGTTTVIDFAETMENENLLNAFDTYYKKADKKSYCDFSFHMTITSFDDEVKKHMKILRDNGITSFKIYMAYKDSLQVDDNIIYNILKESKDLGCRVMAHCENGDLLEALINEHKENNKLLPKYHPLTRPNILEKEAISRLIDICTLTKSSIYVVHLSTREGLEEIRKAKENNIDIYTETCPQYLLLNDSMYDSDSFEVSKYVLSPPLRSKLDVESMWDGVKTGSIDVLSTDHCSFNYECQKELGIKDFSKIPNGMPGVEHRLSTVYTDGVLGNKISLNKFVEITSTNPAKVFGMYPKKGEIQIGSDADLVIINPNKESIITAKSHNQLVDYTPYEGYKVKWSIEDVIIRGNQVVSKGNLSSKDPIGTFIKRKTIN